MTNKNFSITRTLRAPKELVFEAFSTARALTEWWGPIQAPIDVISLDFRPGGTFHYRMNGAQVNYGVMRYKEIDKPNSITWINSFANEKGETIKPPFEGLDFPKEVLNKLTLEEKDGITTLTITSEPMNASEHEVNVFHSITESIQEGFSGTLDQLEQYLAAVQQS
jgi:uncharacterized protein YndB with AHSA1/START domain